MLDTVALTLLAGLVSAAPLTAPVEFDPKNLVYIVSGRDNTCLSIGGGNNQKAFDGLAVISTGCQYANTWILKPETGSILFTTNPAFALDAGENPSDHGGLKIWTSYPGLAQQNWTHTTDGHFQVAKGDQCLDEGNNGIQLYQCTSGNTNQVWHTLPGNITTDLPSASVTFVDSWTVPNQYANTAIPGGNGPAITATVTLAECASPTSVQPGVLYEGSCTAGPQPSA